MLRNFTSVNILYDETITVKVTCTYDDDSNFRIKSDTYINKYLRILSLNVIKQ